MGEITVAILGRPNEEFQIWWRGDRDTGEAPIVHTGRLDSVGRAQAQVPRASLLLGRPVRQSGTPLELQHEEGDTVTVELTESS